MSFKPINTRPELPLDDVFTALVSDDTNPKELGPEELATYRKRLSELKKLVGERMAKTATKEHNYDEAFVTAYIDKVLEDGFNLTETRLSAVPELVDAQRLPRWSDLIAERVELSAFGSERFKIHSLRLLRSNIAKADTLHELRQAVTLMIGPLELYRQHCQVTERQEADDMATMQEFESLCLELEQKDRLLAERKRVIDEILAVYSEDDSDIALLHNIENAKKQHKLSDTEAAGWFGVSRRKLQTLRERLVPKPQEGQILAFDDLLLR